MVLIFNRDVFRLPIGGTKNQAEAGRVVGVKKGVVSDSVRKKKRCRKGFVFVDCEPATKEVQSKMQKVYAIYDYGVEGESIIGIFYTMEEIKQKFGFAYSTTKNLVKSGKLSRHGLKIERFFI